MPSALSHDPQITVPGASTDNAVVIFDGTGGTGFGNSTIVVDSGGNGRIGIATDVNLITLTNETVAVAGAITGVTALTVDNFNLNGNTLTATSGAVNITPAAGSAIVLDGAVNVDAGVVTGVTSFTVDNINIDGNTISSTAGTDLLITPLGGQQLILDGTIIIDAGAVTGATSISSTEFVGGGVGLTALNGTQVTSGTVPVARLGSGSPGSGNFLRGDGSWQAAGGGAADDYFAASGLSTKDLGTGLHIKTGDAGSTTIASGGGELVIEGGSGNHGMSILGSGDGGSYIYLGDAAAPSRAGIIYAHGDDHLVLRSGDATKVTVKSTGIVELTAGLKFPASVNASSDVNTLDDYEEGTWTPTLLDYDLNPNMSQTYGIRQGSYVKIGEVVFIWALINITGRGSMDTSDRSHIGGLPFTPVSTPTGLNGPFIFHSAAGMNITAGNVPSGRISPGNTYVYLANWDISGGTSNLLISELSDDCGMTMSGYYR